MISTGNDIVSFDAINVTRTKQPKFYSKILTTTELSLYEHPDVAKLPFEHFVWLLWSIKESAYKYLQRHQPSLIFSPTKFAVSKLGMPLNFTQIPFSGPQIKSASFVNQELVKSVVTYNSIEFHSCSVMYRELLFSIVHDSEDFNDVSWGIKQIADADPEIQSTEVRSFLLEQLNEGNQPDKYIIEKNDAGCPFVFNGDKETDIAISLAHHARFVGYSIGR